MKNLNGKVAIVTGAGRGLGKAAAVRLAQEGCLVMVNDIDEGNANDTAEKIAKFGVKVAVSTHDIGDSDQAEKMIASCDEQLGGLNILVNNAGILRDAMLSKMTEDQFDQVIRTNLKGVFNGTQKAFTLMRDKGYSGSIINISSVSYLGNIGQTNYAAAKAGVNGMMRTWALELARFNIRVNSIAPGLMETDMTMAIPEKIKTPMIERIPMRRMGKPEEFAALVAFLASDDASYITGQVICIDGASSIGGM